MENLLPTQPSTYWPLIKASLRLYKASFSRVIVLSLLLSCVIFIPRLLSDYIGQNILQNVHLFSLERLWLLPIDLGSMIFLLGMIWRMHCVIINKHEPFIEDFKIAGRKLFYVFIATLLNAAIIMAVLGIVFGFLILLNEHQLFFGVHRIGMFFTALIFLGQLLLILYVATLFIFIIPLITIEDKSILGALEESAYLAWNHWFRIYLVQITPWLVYVLVLLILQQILGINIHIYFTTYVNYSIWTTLIHLVIFALYLPWFTATLLVQLKDLELRKYISS